MTSFYGEFEGLLSDKKFFVTRQFTTAFELWAVQNSEVPISYSFCGTLQSLALELLENNLKKRRILSDQERLLLIKGVIPEDVHLRYAELVDKRIRQFKQSGVSLEEIEFLSRRLTSERSRRKISEALEVLKRYSSLLFGTSGRDLIDVVLEAVPLRDERKVILPVPITLLPFERQFLKERNTAIYLFKAEGTFFSELQSSSIEEREGYRIRELEKNPLSEVLDFNFYGRVSTFTEIKVVPFSSESGRVSFIVNSVLDLLSKGLSPHEIAVVGDDIEEKLPQLYEAFKEYKIPFNFQKGGIPVTAAPAVKRVLNRNRNKKLSLKEWLEEILRVHSGLTDTGNGNEVGNQLYKLLSEVEGLERLGVVGKGRLSRREILDFLRNRFFLVEDNEPFGVHVCSPESAVTLFPKAIVFDNLSEGIYPRSFPKDPDFTWKEKEEINRILGREKPALQVFPLRKTLISYDFLTFFNLLSLRLDYFYASYNVNRGESLFVRFLREKAPVTISEEPITRDSYVAYLSMKGLETEFGNNREKRVYQGVRSWKLKGSNPEYNFFIKKDVVRKYLKVITPSNIIEYLNCPASAFFSVFFKPERKPLFDQIEGTIYHKALELLFSGEEDVREAVQKAKEEVLKDVCDPVVGDFVKIATDHIVDNLEKFWLRFKGLDISKFPKKTEEEISYRLSDLEVRGRADLVIFKEDEIWIVDFKTGSLEKMTSSDPRTLQLLLYYLSIRNRGKSRLIYMSITKAKTAKSRSEWVREIPPSVELLNRIKVVIGLMKEGCFIPHEPVIKFDGDFVRVTFRRNPCYGDYQLNRETLERIESGLVKKVKRRKA